jgi:hypothetical protein
LSSDKKRVNSDGLKANKSEAEIYAKNKGRQNKRHDGIVYARCKLIEGVILMMDADILWETNKPQIKALLNVQPRKNRIGFSLLTVRRLAFCLTAKW